ncbi:DUF6270 domain-containing protein [Arthrobacter sp. OVS8]|nr:DUF6270 domain-containing protein [Arthrobacter sp. OVS8]
MPKNVMIYGSAVSPDVIGDMDSDFRLLRHVAGQSMISALSRPAVLLEGPADEFPSAALEGDIKSSLLKRVRRYASDLDVLVINLADERHGVVRLPDGTFVTLTPELRTSGLLDTIRGTKTIISPVTERHWTLWEAAANRLFKALTELGMRNRTIVIDTPWAEVANSGTGDSQDPGPSTSELNAYFIECCAHIRSLGFSVETLPEELRAAAPRDNPGAAPIPFGAAANSWIAQRIADVRTVTSLTGAGV